MVDFKKRLKDLRQLELVIPPAPPAQKEMVVCQCCGHTWTDDAKAVEKSWKAFPGIGPLCDICWLLRSVRIQAHVRGISFKTACWRFLKGQAKRLGITWEKVWQGRDHTEESR